MDGDYSPMTTPMTREYLEICIWPWPTTVQRYDSYKNGKALVNWRFSFVKSNRAPLIFAQKKSQTYALQVENKLIFLYVNPIILLKPKKAVKTLHMLSIDFC